MKLPQLFAHEDPIPCPEAAYCCQKVLEDPFFLLGHAFYQSRTVYFRTIKKNFAETSAFIKIGLIEIQRRVYLLNKNVSCEPAAFANCNSPFRKLFPPAVFFCFDNFLERNLAAFFFVVFLSRQFCKPGTYSVHKNRFPW